MKRLIIAMRLGVIAGIIFALAATAFPASQTGESQVHIVPRAGPEAKHSKDPRVGILRTGLRLPGRRP